MKINFDNSFDLVNFKEPITVLLCGIRQNLSSPPACNNCATSYVSIPSLGGKVPVCSYHLNTIINIANSR